MSYMQRLRARSAEKRPARELPELPKGPSVGFGSAQGDRFSSGEAGKDREGIRLDAASAEERAALVEHDGDVPAAFADAFSQLQQSCPAHVPEARWHQFINDGGVFLDAWGHQAAALGWTPFDLFGLDPIAPMARYDRQGLVWMLRGDSVRLLDERSASLSNGLVYRRVQGRTS